MADANFSCSFPDAFAGTAKLDLLRKTLDPDVIHLLYYR